MTLELLNAIYGLAYIAGLLVAAVSLVSRSVRYRRAGWRMPRLLVRDLVLVLGLALPFAGTLFSRAFGWGLGMNPLWVLVTGALAVGSIWVFVYHELFVIERPRR
jgi:hypothetical protein